MATPEVPQVPEVSLETPSVEFQRPVTPTFFSAEERASMEAGRARRSSDAVDSMFGDFQ